MPDLPPLSAGMAGDGGRPAPRAGGKRIELPDALLVTFLAPE